MGCIILSSYLVLLIMFYISTDRKPTTNNAVKHAMRSALTIMQETAEVAADVLRSTNQALSESLPGESSVDGLRM